MKKTLKRIFLAITAIFVVLLALTIIDMYTGSMDLYKWDVQVSLNVRNDQTGEEIVHYRLMYSIFDSKKYREAKFKNNKYIITMEYCRGEGLIRSFFNEKAMPIPSYYTFKISGQGYKEKLIDGKICKVKSLNRTGKYELLLPEVRLHKLDSYRDRTPHR